MAARFELNKKDVIQKALLATKPAFFNAIFFSFFLNLAGLAAPLYMLQIYDRVLLSRSLSTLTLLTLLVAFIYASSALLEILRSKVLIRAGIVFDKMANPGVFRAVQQATIISPSPRHVQSLRDLDNIREFFTGSGILALCDFPWAPVYIFAAFMLNPLYGLLAIGSLIITLVLAVINEIVTKNALGKAGQEAISASSQSVATFRNAEVLRAMGMVEALRYRWSKHHEATLGWQAEASNRGGLLIALTKFSRTLVQSLILGVGAYLVIQKEVTPGMMIAASIIIGKALQPVETVIGQRKSFDAMRSSYKRLKSMLDAMPSVDEKISLPPPKGDITFENVIVLPPGSRTPVLTGISLKIPAGSSVGVVGPSAAGKSSLARALVNVWPVASGSIRLDGSELEHWNAAQLGENIGYLPQDVELFSGTVAENISSFIADADDSDIIEAARIAGCHEMIQQFTDGYNTKLGEGGQSLSGGQRQRIGLARAVYGLPSLIVLDEPNANLDSLGEQALLGAIEYLKKQNKTLIIITHKTNVLVAVDYVLVMNSGKVQNYGPTAQILDVLSGNQKTNIANKSNNLIRTVPAA